MTPARHRHLATIRVCSDMAPINPNAVLYFVISSYKGSRYVVESDLDRMTREQTIRGIRSGELTDIVSIIETEFTDNGLSSRDVTAALLMEADLMRGMAPEPTDRQAAAFDHDRDERKHWRAL